MYLDVGSHPEYATPECANLDDLLVHERAGETGACWSRWRNGPGQVRTPASPSTSGC